MNFERVLAHTDRRSLQGVLEVLSYIKASPESLSELCCLLDDTYPPALRMRVMDVLEKFSLTHVNALQAHKARFINTILLDPQQEVRWHIAQILPRLDLNNDEADYVMNIFMQEYVHDQSSIVKTFTMQALADLSIKYGLYAKEVRALIKQLTKSGTAAMKNRGAKLLKKLDEKKC